MLGLSVGEVALVVTFGVDGGLDKRRRSRGATGDGEVGAEEAVPFDSRVVSKIFTCDGVDTVGVGESTWA